MPMIERTDEMVTVAYDQVDFVYHTRDSVEAAVQAVLDVIHRNYRLSKVCTEELVPGLRCRRPEHARGDHEGKSSTGNTVKWT